jgi:protocatechuate 3,4-dioxygenase beta subunit
MTMKPSSILWSLMLVGCSSAGAQQRAREPVVGGGEDMETVFVGMPARIDAKSRLAPVGSQGEPMRLTGIVKDQRGRAIEGIIVYAYQTDAGGIYPRSQTRHGAFRGWAKTDKDGRYSFETVRPGSYPNSRNPQHIHMHVIESGRCTYWIDDVHFTDDPLLTDTERNRREPRGGLGVATPRKVDGIWVAQRDITLGLHVPGYPPR